MRLTTHTVSPPSGVHPLWWTLTDVVGLQPSRVRQLARVSGSVVHALTTGRRVDPPSLLRLVQLLDHARGEMNRDVPDRRDVSPTLKAYRSAVFALISETIAQYTRPPDLPTPRQTELSDNLLRAVGPGRLRALVLGDLRHLHTSQSVRRAARRLGVLERLVGGQVTWLPPPGAPPVAFDPPERVFRQPTGLRQTAAHDALSVFLGRRPTASATATEAVAYLTARGHARSMVFRAAREMNLVRVTTGFGPRKVSTWSLPPAPPDPPDEAADDEATDDDDETAVEQST